MARRCLSSGVVNRLIQSSNKSAPNRLLSSAALRIQNPSPLTAFAAQSRTFATQGNFVRKCNKGTSSKHYLKVNKNIGGIPYTAHGAQINPIHPPYF